MDLRGKALMFVERKTRKDGKQFTACTFSIGSKEADGTYVNKSIDVRFSKEKFSDEKLAKLDPEKYYEVDLVDAFLMPVAYVNRNGEKNTKFVAFVNALNIIEAHQREKKPAETKPVTDGLPW